MMTSPDSHHSVDDSALHRAVEWSRLSDAMEMLIHGACADCRDAQGNTPLHKAVKSGSLSLVHAFIVFGCDVDARNAREESARHLAAAGKRRGLYDPILFALHAVGAERCPQTMTSCAEGCAADGRFDGIPPEDFFKNAETMLKEVLPPVSSGTDLRVLCLDGGGVRGLLLIQMLEEIEKLMGRPILRCFDFVAATGSGSLLALALAKGKTLAECRRLYFHLKESVFTGFRPHSKGRFKEFLKDELGESTLMGDIQKPRLMITATRACPLPAELHIFRNYKSPQDILNGKEHPGGELMWKAARTSVFAPFFLSSDPDGLMDGGVVGNNPTIDALTDIFQCNRAAREKGDAVSKIRVLLSVGTGRPPSKQMPKEEFNYPYKISSVESEEEIVAAVSMLLNKITQTEPRDTARAGALCRELHIPYYRLNPELTDFVAVDETHDDKLLKMLWEATAHMRRMRTELLALKTHLDACAIPASSST